MGVVVWPMVEFEADDALAAAAVRAADDPRVDRVIICTPDKDLAQCVRGTRIVQLNRRTRVTIDEAGVVAKFGVPPASIPDYLALVGDAADGYPGLKGWVPSQPPRCWRVGGISKTFQPTGGRGASTPRTPAALAATLEKERSLALLFRTLATLRTDVPVFGTVDELEWKGPRPEFTELAGAV
jgi:5'-3' exonuclease